MPGNILFYLVICIMIKENAETNEDNSLNKWRMNVSSETYQFENREAVKDVQKLENNGFLKSARNPNDTISRWSNLLRNYIHKSVVQHPTAIALEKESRNNPTLSKSCYNVPVYMSVCPGDFTYLRNGRKNLCYKIIENQTFPPSCPYAHYLPYHEIVKIARRYFNDKHIWLHAFRNNAEFGFVQFEWIENSMHYGQTVTEEINNPEDVQGRNCLIIQHDLIFRVSCQEKHYSLCVYSTERLESSLLINTCKQKNYDECIVGDYDLENFKCYCKFTNSSQPTKADFCSKLAEPIHPFQTQLLINYLKLDSDMCWFGMYKTTSEIYKWSSTNENVNYTRWAKPENCGYSEGAFKFGTSPYHGWALATDRTLNCAICEFIIQFKTPTLELEYNPSRNDIQLRIKHIESISKPDTLGLYCFSDSNSNDFKEAVGIIHPDPYYTNNTWSTVKIAKVANHPSYYWCEAFEYSSKNIIRSNIILAYKPDNFGNEFAIVVSYNIEDFTDPFINNTHTNICKNISQQIKQKYDYLELLRPMRAHFNEDSNLMVMLMHLTTTKIQKTIEAIYNQILEILRSVEANDPHLMIVSFLSSEACLPDNTTTPDNAILEWPQTNMGATAIPSNQLCLDESRDMLPVTRYCEGDFLYGAKWAKPIGTCLENTTYSEATEKLFDLIHSDAPANNITNDLVQMTQENVNNDPIDIHLVSVVLEKLITGEDEDIESHSFSNVISNVMYFDKQVLRDAQRLLNSTDKIISSLDKFMHNQSPLLLILPRLVVQITNLKKSNISGLALYTETSEIYDFKSYRIDHLYANTSFDNLLQQENLDTAVLIPENVLNNLRYEFTDKETIRLIIMIFYNDFLFNEQENVGAVQQSKTKIISVSVSGFTGQLESPIRMAFKMPNNYLNIKNCSRWVYGLDQFMVSTYGQWQTDVLSQEKSNLLETCEFSHMTHFGVLLQNNPREVSVNEVVLNILTIIGSALSLIGIIPIFVTAIIFKSWRSRPGNIILINFCMAITFQIILMFSSSAITSDGVGCKFIGASIHYMVLSEFCWMFVVALLQYRRFVVVFKPQEETIVTKCLIVGWGFPLIPVVITISISVENYKMNAYGICSIVGYYYIFGYMLPIIIILCSNAFIFIKIVYNVSRQSTETCIQRSRNYKLEILLALFLFFVLGMTWIFGIIGAFGAGVWSTYIFCITATLRGLVLFLFFIAGNKETRLMWKKRSTYYMEKKLRKQENMPSSNVTTISSE